MSSSWMCQAIRRRCSSAMPRSTSFPTSTPSATSCKTRSTCSRRLASALRAFAHGLLRCGRPVRRCTPTRCGVAEDLIVMDALLVVNAGSSSVKFQIFGIEGGAPRRLIKGQIDGIGTRPRLAAEANDKSLLIDRTYASDKVPDVPAAIAAVASWLRETQRFNVLAGVHRVVHGGPKYDRPVLIDHT